jgi:hypothetical protein
MNKVHSKPIQCLGVRPFCYVSGLGLDLFICLYQSVNMCNRINQTYKGIAFVIHSLCMQSFQCLRTSSTRGLDHGVFTCSARICLLPFGCIATYVARQDGFPHPTYYGGSLPHTLFGHGPYHSSSIAPTYWFRLLQPLTFLIERCDVYCIEVCVSTQNKTMTSKMH